MIMTSTTRNRFGNLGAGTGLGNGEHARNTNGMSLGAGFGSGAAAWNPGIWSKTAIGSGLKGNPNDDGRILGEVSNPPTSEAITGSGSLLPSSESDTWSGRHWKSLDNTSPRLPKSHSSTSPIRRQNSNQAPVQPFADSVSSASSYFPMPTANPLNQGVSGKSSQSQYLDPTSSSFVGNGVFDTAKLGRSSRHNSDEEGRGPTKSLTFGGIDTGGAFQNARQNYYSSSGYTSSAASRSGSLPPSRNAVNQSSRFVEDNLRQPNSTITSTAFHRPNLSTQSSLYPSHNGFHNQRFSSQSNSADMGTLAGDFNRMNVGRGNQGNSYPGQRDQRFTDQDDVAFQYNQQLSPDEAWSAGDSEYPGAGEQFSLDSMPQEGMGMQGGPYRNPLYGSYSHSPSNSDARRSQHSPFYSAGGTPSIGYPQRAPSRGSYSGTVTTGQAALLDRKLRGLQQEQQGYPGNQPNPLHSRQPYPNLYDFHTQQALRMAAYYPIPPVPNILTQPQIPRGPAKDHEIGWRSQLLEEFRSNSKTNKRYELKDIYNHIVEFSGDQHGSRFIQLKLETANSDEKDQVFREIHPNSIQLMTDVFGNYVIQKFFEHGNQSQKKILANQMRNHVLTLSLQMYGCRVVQKALEHILTDQQAQLVKELEKDVLRCVKDQNGNHVIQKAIERVPAEHIQFIINAFTGQVQALATHPYGCRVIQRMLEHCEQPTRIAVLQELHACTMSLIVDQFGNYVTQHVIEHGREEDRALVISLVTSHLVNFSRHKFASNVVEKSLQFGAVEQRQKIVSILTTPMDEKGNDPLALLIRDQYGNYVIQKLLALLKGSEFDDFAEHIKPHLAAQKRFGGGKNIMAIEKFVYGNATSIPPLHTNNAVVNHNPPRPPLDTSAAPTPPLVSGDGPSPQSSSLPSTNASSVGGPVHSRKSSAGNTVEVITPTST